jgi:hypothetical protein
MLALPRGIAGCSSGGDAVPVVNLSSDCPLSAPR